jgi:transposase
VYSRHCFVWLSFSQTTETVIEGFESAWEFFGGVFKVVIPDNMSTAVTKADRIDPRLNQAFVEYAQARGFVIDPARVRAPTDKGCVAYCTSWVGCGGQGLGRFLVPGGRPTARRGIWIGIW